jgi:hypothetical protein
MKYWEAEKDRRFCLESSTYFELEYPVEQKKFSLKGSNINSKWFDELNENSTILTDL